MQTSNAPCRSGALRWFGASALMLLCAAAPAATGPKSSAAFCVLSVEETGKLAIAEPGGTMRLKIFLGERPHEIDVSADGRTAYISMFGITDYDSRIGTPGSLIRTVDLIKGALGKDFVLPVGLTGPHGVKLRPGKPTELYVNAEVGGDAMLVFDTRSFQLLRRFAMPEATHNFVFSRDGSAIFSFAGAKGVTRTDATSGLEVAHVDVGSAVRGLAMLPSGYVLAAANGEVIVLRPSDLKILHRLKTPQGGQYAYPAALADGTIMAPSLAHGGVAVFPKGRLPASFVKTGETTLSARVGPDGLVYVANVDDDHITVLDTKGRSVGSIANLSHPNGLSFGACPRR